MTKEKKIYNAWKANSKLEPIEGTDRILEGKSKRAIIRHLAYEEGVEHNHNDVLVKCKDGTFWFVSKI
jgi:hypothetical protein